MLLSHSGSNIWTSFLDSKRRACDAGGPVGGAGVGTGRVGLLQSPLRRHQKVSDAENLVQGGHSPGPGRKLTVKREVGSVAKRRAAPLPKDPGCGQHGSPFPVVGCRGGGEGVGWAGMGSLPASLPGAGPVLQRDGQPVPLRLPPDALLQPYDALRRPLHGHLPQLPVPPLSSLYRVAPELVGPCRTPPPRHP